MSTDVGFCWAFVFGDMVIFRKVFEFKEIYINLFRRCVPIANLFYFIHYLLSILEHLVMNVILSPHMH